MITIPSCHVNTGECQKYGSHALTFTVQDDLAGNRDLKRFPKGCTKDATGCTEVALGHMPLLTEPSLALEVEFLELKDFKMYARDDVVVNLAIDTVKVKAGDNSITQANVRNMQFYIATAPGQNVCTAGEKSTANELRCQKLTATCMAAQEWVIFRATRGGSFCLFQYRCGDLVQTTQSSWSQLQGYVATWPFDAKFMEFWHEKWRERTGLKASATAKAAGKINSNDMPIRLRFRPKVRWVAKDHECYTGEFDRFTTPVCALYQDKKDGKGS